MTSSISFATGPVTWGVDFADAPDNPPWREVLDDIERSGIGAMELGPVGYLPEDPETLRAELGRRGLSAVGSVVFDEFHNSSRIDEVLAAGERACRALAGADGTFLVIIDRPDEVRAATAGRSGAAPRLDERRWSGMLDGIVRMADLARGYGLRPVVHAHAGGYVEFEDEIDRLLGDCDLDLCFDTGHAAYAGLDPAAAIRRLGQRVAYVHVKDIRPEVLATVHRDGLSFWQAIETGIFCPIGEGMVDVGAVFEALGSIGYRGPVTIEQDRVPGHGAPLEELQRSLAVLRAALAGDP